MYIWPWAIKKSMLLEKDLPFLEDRKLELPFEDFKKRLQNARKEGKIVLLKGPGATDYARKFSSQTSVCAYLDFCSLYNMNAYDSLSFQHLGFRGNILNVFMKLSIFATSIMNRTLGNPEFISPLSMNCFD